MMLTNLLKFEKAYLYFLRSLAILVILKSAIFWLHLLQFSMLRIYETPAFAKIVAAQIVFAAIYPIIAVGLWMSASWGVILWLLTALFEACAFGFHFTAFSANPHITAMDCVLIFLFILFNLFFLRHDKAAQN
ncbi:DUF6163 family protein [Bartonella sp. TP]|uniref:DUF6163 family protein n=1 Tax=Bartonella sp. TP TaxID=3057550 RepID=UPI0025B05A56|nr:DUF6163 family protein [Bartonella sp. TP]MDN5248784.1 DUF6163 family protein [Alphaproteobacteria bacterium]WJW80048.1 DUF6163 family protein [Bartonella sp. TP]